MTAKRDILEKIVTCKRCGYTDKLKTYNPAYGVYNDCKCPTCGSTNNEHNAWYQRELMKNANSRPRPTHSSKRRLNQTQ